MVKSRHLGKKGWIPCRGCFEIGSSCHSFAAKAGRTLYVFFIADKLEVWQTILLLFSHVRMEAKSNNETPGFDPRPLLRERRKITGMSAILLPFSSAGQVDWDAFQAHLQRTVEVGLIPAVNMDTGFSALIDPATRGEVLLRTRDQLHGAPFVAGVFHADHPGDELNVPAYAAGIEQIQSMGGMPILFQSFGLSHHADDQIVDNYRALAHYCDQFLAFELGQMFAPFGRIYAAGVYSELLKIPQCVGAKHSSLNRQLEWDRLVIRNEQRPEFKVLTGNDLAIDMVMYGSDYLLGLSTFAPDLFARRDRFWLDGDPRFYELNDVLQYLGFFAFREPTSAYKHSAAMFLKMRGWIPCDATHPDSPGRPAGDIAVLAEIGQRLGLEMKE